MAPFEILKGLLFSVVEVIVVTGLFLLIIQVRREVCFLSIEHSEEESQVLDVVALSYELETLQWLL